MNRLSIERRARILGCLVEGNSLRATARMTDSAKNTVVKLLVDVGQACSEYQDKALRNLSCKRLQCDEIWSFCYAKEKNVPQDKKGQLGYGDVWTFVAIDADTKLAISWLVGLREPFYAYEFFKDIYTVPLGQPIGSRYYENGLWKRKFQNGVISVDIFAKKGKIVLNNGSVIQ